MSLLSVAFWQIEACVGLITLSECDGETSLMRRHLRVKRQCEADERSTYIRILFPCYANIFHHLRLNMKQMIFYFQKCFPTGFVMC